MSNGLDELGAPIEKTPLPNRAKKWLRAAGIRTIGDLLQRTQDDLLVIPNFSLTSLKHVGEFLQQHGLNLAPRRSNGCPRQWVSLGLEDSRVGLSRRERDVLKLRYGLNQPRPLTLEEVGRRFDLTRERVRQVQKIAECKIIIHMIFVRGMAYDTQVPVGGNA